MLLRLGLAVTSAAVSRTSHRLRVLGLCLGLCLRVLRVAPIIATSILSTIVLSLSSVCGRGLARAVARRGMRLRASTAMLSRSRCLLGTLGVSRCAGPRGSGGRCRLWSCHERVVPVVRKSCVALREAHPIVGVEILRSVHGSCHRGISARGIAGVGWHGLLCGLVPVAVVGIHGSIHHVHGCGRGHQ